MLCCILTDTLLVSVQAQYRESNIYLAKFRQCLSRALLLLKTHVFNILHHSTQQVLPAKVRYAAAAADDDDDDVIGLPSSVPSRRQQADIPCYFSIT